MIRYTLDRSIIFSVIIGFFGGIPAGYLIFPLVWGGQGISILLIAFISTIIAVIIISIIFYNKIFLKKNNNIVHKSRYSYTIYLLFDIFGAFIGSFPGFLIGWKLWEWYIWEWMH